MKLLFLCRCNRLLLLLFNVNYVTHHYYGNYFWIWSTAQLMWKSSYMQMAGFWMLSISNTEAQATNKERQPLNFVINFPLNNLIKFHVCVAYNMQWALVTHQPSPHQSDPMSYPLFSLSFFRMAKVILKILNCIVQHWKMNRNDCNK